MLKFPAFEKWLSTRPKTSLAVFLLLLFVGTGSGWLSEIRQWLKPQTTSKPPVEVNINNNNNQTTTDSSKTTGSIKGENSECKIVGKLPENKSEWNTNLYSQRWGDTDFFFPRIWKDPVMWFSKPVNPNFQEIYLEYKIVTDSKSNETNPPSLILEFAPSISNEWKGNNSVFKMWLPESNGDNPPQLFGFAKYSELTNQLDREPSETLTSSVSPGKQDKLKISPEIINGNEITYMFDYTFTSNVNGSIVPYSKPKTVTFPNAIDSTATYYLGIGTYAGNKIQVMSYRICQK